MRGVGMFLVVLGHACDPYIDWNIVRLLKEIIYSFHMPLFFFISGFFSYKVFNHSGEIYPILSKYAKKLLGVYLFCSVLIVPLKLVFSSYAERKLAYSDCLNIFFFPVGHPMATVWFLYVLFLIHSLFVLLGLVLHVNRGKAYHIISIVIFLIGVYSIGVMFPVKLFAINLICQYSLYYFIGYVVNYHFVAIDKVINEWLFLVLFFPCLWWFYLKYNNLHLVKVIFAFLGIVVVWAYSNLMVKKNGVMKLLFKIIADYSFPIYIYSYFFQIGLKVFLIHFVGFTTLALFPLQAIVGVLLPIVLARYVLERSCILRKVALGEWGGSSK
jgi:fucose 4-O-acetylase-like acetyltransferase